MKFASYINAEGSHGFGALSADSTRLCNLAQREVPSLRDALIQWGAVEVRARARNASYDVDATSVRWLPPIPQPGKIICVGINYRSHGAEAGRNMPEHPSVFIRLPDSLVGHGESVLVPTSSAQLDFEGELAVVIGRPARRVSPEEGLSYVAGYSCFAENSVRDYQKHATQVTAGKNFFASGGWGPTLVTADEIPDPSRLEVICRLNGDQMQRDRISSLVYPIGKIISYISEFTPLAPGDVIATGTPAGVGFLRKPPVFMKDGDVLEVEVTSVGVLRLPVRQEPA